MTFFYIQVFNSVVYIVHVQPSSFLPTNHFYYFNIILHIFQSVYMQ